MGYPKWIWRVLYSNILAICRGMGVLQRNVRGQLNSSAGLNEMWLKSWQHLTRQRTLGGNFWIKIWYYVKAKMFSIPWLISNIRLHECKKGWKQTSLEGKPHKTVLLFLQICKPVQKLLSKPLAWLEKSTCYCFIEAFPDPRYFGLMLIWQVREETIWIFFNFSIVTHLHPNFESENCWKWKR